MTDTPTPLVSVVIATYNRSAVLQCAIASALRSTLQNLEVIVIGDGCTDDTAQRVAAISDPRVRFENLASSVGDQSGPHNRAMVLARGRFIAFLNHDDLYFPDHLERGIARLESSGADFLWTPTLTILPPGHVGVGDGPWRVEVRSTPRNGVYDPMQTYPASSWIIRRELADRIGPWRCGRDLYVFPSQDWSFRVWRSGARMVFHPHPGVIVVTSGWRVDSYLSQDPSEHHELLAAMVDQRQLRETLLEQAAVSQAARLAGPPDAKALLLRLFETALSPLLRILVHLHIHPKTPYGLLRFGKGGATRAHRRTVGLAP